MYRTDRLKFLLTTHHKAIESGYFIGVKLVRGAYMEKERKRAEDLGYISPIHLSKGDTDRDFNEAVKYCIQNIETISMFCGTHNEESVSFAMMLMEQYGIDHGDPRVFFSQLLGMSDNISFNLAASDYNASKYIPYGPVKEVLPYLIRRAQENTSVKGQTGRELSLIKTELKRRANSVKNNK
jgi:proline dehydrogenase